MVKNICLFPLLVLQLELCFFSFFYYVFRGLKQIWTYLLIFFQGTKKQMEPHVALSVGFGLRTPRMVLLEGPGVSERPEESHDHHQPLQGGEDRRNQSMQVIDCYWVRPQLFLTFWEMKGFPLNSEPKTSSTFAEGSTATKSCVVCVPQLFFHRLEVVGSIGPQKREGFFLGQISWSTRKFRESCWRNPRANCFLFSGCESGNPLVWILVDWTFVFEPIDLEPGSKTDRLPKPASAHENSFLFVFVSFWDMIMLTLSPYVKSCSAPILFYPIHLFTIIPGMLRTQLR